MKFRSRTAMRLLAIGAFVLMPAYLACAAAAQGYHPWTLGIVDTTFVWSPPSQAMHAIHECAYDLAKSTGYVAAKAQPGEESPLQHCLVEKMRDAGAPANAIAFTKWYYNAPNGDSAYITGLSKPQFGPVQLATVAYPGRANNNDGYLFVNGTNPKLTNPDVAFAQAAQPWLHDPAYLAILHAHPNAMVYPGLSFVSLTRREGGGQRFVLSAPIVDGCHACARLGAVHIAYDFGQLGAPKGLSVVSVQR